MSGIFLIFLVLVVLNFRTIKNEFNNVKRKTWIVLFLIFLLGFWLRNAEYSYGVHTDGFVYSESAKYIVKEGMFVKDCAVGHPESCRLYEQVLFPAGYPYIISLAYILFGINSLYASVISAILSSLTIVIIFLVGYHLFKNETTGLLVSLIFALTPLDIIFSSTGNVRTTALFFMALTLLFYLIARKKNTVKSWSLVAITFSYLIYVKQENSVLLVPMLLGLFLLGYFRSGDINTEFIKKAIKKFLLPLILFLVTQIPVQYWIMFHIYYGAEAGFKLQYFTIISQKIVKTFFLPDIYIQNSKYSMLFNPILSVFFIASILLFFKKDIRYKLIFIWSLFLVYFLIYSSFAQSLEQAMYGNDYLRFIQMLVLPYSLIVSVIISGIVERFRIKKEYFLVAILFIIVLTTPISFQTTLFKDSRTKEPIYQSLYFDAVNKTPNNCTIITSHYIIPNSDVFENNNRRTANIWLISNNTEQIFLDEFSEAECLIFFKDWFCKTTDNKIYNNEQCKFLYDNLDLKYLYNITKNNMIITVYNATLKHK
jgi:hypothetical protein